MPVTDYFTPGDRSAFSGALWRMTNKPLLAPVSGTLSKLLKLEYLDQFCSETREIAAGLGFLGEALDRLNIGVDISPEDLARIPKTGAVVAVANHPLGMAEGIALIWLLAQHRPDFRVLANDMLGALPDVRPFLILVDPFGGESAQRANRRSLREAKQWLERGGMLVIFPAGEVSHMRFMPPGIHDPDWSRTAAALIKHSGAAALPFYLEGANSALFQIAGLVHPRLRTALPPRELLNKQGQVLRMRVGHPAVASKFESLDDERATELLRRVSVRIREASAQPPQLNRLQHAVEQSRAASVCRRQIQIRAREDLVENRRVLRHPAEEARSFGGRNFLVHRHAIGRGTEDLSRPGQGHALDLACNTASLADGQGDLAHRLRNSSTGDKDFPRCGIGHDARVEIREVVHVNQRPVIFPVARDRDSTLGARLLEHPADKPAAPAEYDSRA